MGFRGYTPSCKDNKDLGLFELGYNSEAGFKRR